MPNIKIGDVFINRTKELVVVVAQHKYLKDHYHFYYIKYNVKCIVSINSDFNYWYKRLTND